MFQYYDAFISYGRADSKAFATKLYDDLTKQGFKIWFDQNDIPLGVDFQNQIDDGIEKSHNFLFIIAPHSVNSPYCRKEIELAVKYKKRIIPLLHVEEISYKTWQRRNPGKTEADWEEYKAQGRHSSFPNMHPEIGKINWVWFKEKINDYDQSLTDLIKLFHHQEDYVQKHTQILVKALEWERHQKLTRYLLIAKERERAEKWLKVEFKNEQPPCIPTDLQCEFICESIKNANNLLTQVFLAYGQEDRERMVQIRNSLMRHGITVWTNQTDIKTGEEFQEAINRGIEGADSFVYLLSYESLNSKYCQDELARAFSLNKRIIAVLITPTDSKTIPRKLKELQFIDLTDEEQSQKNLDNLIKEVAENAVYYQQHKVLLVKALKWQEQNRNRSILLRGYNLEHYQSWLEVARTKNLHPPTDLQVEFIAESAKKTPDLAIDVFISYSRADADFARKLNDALQTQGKTTWFDQESIATGTDFQAEIHRGIEQSDNFLFVISPDSVNSQYCAGEVEYARSLNKRFVTVLHRGVNVGELHPELAKVQWLDFNRLMGDFLGNFSELVRTLDTDREYVREHTKKSQMALEWKRGNKSKDLLLRGSECAKAYQWWRSAQIANKQPAVSEEVKEFILESKAEVERSQRANLVFFKALLSKEQEVEPKALSRQEYRFRQILLNKVKNYWIKGVLESSLHGKLLIELGLEERLNAVERPWDVVWSDGENEEKSLPVGTRVVDKFEELGEGRSLLILGEPGAGKTITLLELAKDLIKKAEQNVTLPIPVVFNLSSWTSAKQSIADWLMQELHSKYQVSKEIGKTWIKEQQLLLLLDGLDEVNSKIRQNCVDALNQFCHECGQTEIVVCSRIKDYEALSSRFKFQAAIYLQPLSKAQITQYLQGGGAELEGLKNALKNDSILQDLAASPLMLSIMTLTYPGVAIEELPQTNTQARCQHLFDTYIEKMFQRRVGKASYSKEKTKRWLIWLAKRMVERSQTVFLIERMQPSWLENKLLKYLYLLLVYLTVSLGLFFTEIFLRMSTLVFLDIYTAIVFLSLEQWLIALIFALVTFGIFFGSKIETVEALKWNGKSTIIKISLGVAIGAFVGILLGIANNYYSVNIYDIVPGMSLGLIVGIIKGFTGPTIEEATVPNQGVWRSIENAVIFGLVGCTVTAIAAKLLNYPNRIILYWGVYGLICGLGAGGGEACIKHFILRVILYIKGYIPWNYARFLDSATELIFLQKVGGGYIFIHRLLLEHFARKG